MDTLIIRDVNELIGSERQSLEQLLGTRLSETQKVYIMAFTPGKEPEAHRREESAGTIERILDKAAQYAADHRVTETDIDEAVDEAMNEIRRRDSA